MTEKKECKYNKCPGIALENDEFCIFHSKDIEGKKADFDEKFLGEFDNQKKNKMGYNFSGFVFPNIINFKIEEFTENAIFENAQFFEGVKFEDTKFSKHVDFSHAKFYGDINFSHAKFSEIVKFNNSEFYGNVDFHHSEFSQTVFFDDIRFYGKADFSSVKFLERASFYKNRFSGDAKFIEMHVSGIVDFFDSKFLGKAKFEKVHFSGKAEFSNTRFSGRVEFRESEFSKKVDFRGARFFGDIYFLSLKFYGDVYFWNANFSGDTKFTESKFYEEVSFQNAKFYGSVDFSRTAFSGNVRFENVLIEEYNSLIMTDTYFHDVSGLLEFIEVNKKQFKYPYVGKSSINKKESPKNSRISKKTAKATPLKKTLVSILENCKFLILKFIRTTEFLPGNFKLILGEKTTAKYPIVSRKIKDDIYLLNYKKNRSIIQIPLWWLWWLLADFGRSFLRWAVGSVLFALIFAFIFYEIGPDSFCIEHLSDHSFLTMLYYSVVTFTTLGFGDITPTTTGASIWVMLEVILGYIMLGGLISIFANKLARRS